MDNAATDGSVPASLGNPPEFNKLYLSTFDRVVDKSGRVLLPNEWREIGDRSFLIIAWPIIGNSEYLTVLPPGEAVLFQQKLQGIPVGDAAKTITSRFIANKAFKCQLDNYGRLPIPDAAARAVGIKDRIKLVGGNARFELWDPDRYEAYMANPQVIAQVQLGLQTLNI